MDVKELIENERKWLQDILDRFLSTGCYVDVHPMKDGKDEDWQPLFRATVSGLRVLRVAPKFDAAGDHTGSTFWVMWNSLGYSEGFQYTHTIIVTRIENTDDPILDLWGGEYHHRVGTLYPDEIDEHKERFESLKEWRAYQAENAERFTRIDAQLLEEHTEIANTWPEN